jgi:hypothetical protein
MFGALSVFGRHIKGMIRLRPEQVWACNVTRYHRPLLSPSGSRNKLGTPRCNARSILLRHEARDRSSDRNCVWCQSLATLRRFSTWERYMCVPTLTLGVVVATWEGRICTRWLPLLPAKVTRRNQQQISEDVGVCAEIIESHRTLVKMLSYSTNYTLSCQNKPSSAVHYLVHKITPKWHSLHPHEHSSLPSPTLRSDLILSSHSWLSNWSVTFRHHDW